MAFLCDFNEVKLYYNLSSFMIQGKSQLLDITDLESFIHSVNSQIFSLLTQVLHLGLNNLFCAQVNEIKSFTRAYY